MPRKKLPLERKDYVETDPASGTTIRRTVYQRGLLRTEAIQYEDPSVDLLALSKKEMRKKFEDLRMRAQAVLREAELPTDEDSGKTRMPKEIAKNGKIKAQDFVTVISFKDWPTIVEERTEPLSRERSAMLLIKGISMILKQDLDQDALRHIWFLMHVHHRFEMLVHGINEAAVSAHEAGKALQKGPQARAAKGQRTEDIVRKLVTAHWKSVPLRRGKQARTVDAIRGELNTRLEAKGLKSIGQSQITNYVRDIIRDSAKQEG
ncbi:hypothetical protein AA309_25365 [Microvirga vignae]|uniref:Uncharacterized protein n=1 Tax=Microvirga vignae TaxID=1225564 RepID=A0A0H1R5X0_9HYPH|nr:hypothetical protein [Microvirga vignae]KLK90538.1 hypothetical protein AA309_25365 [Microvirga vignae]